MGFSGHRLLAVLLAVAVAVLSRPSGAFAADGPVAVNCAESGDVSLHTARRATTSLDREFREFAGAIPDVVHCPRERCVACLSLRDATDTVTRTCGRWLARPRGPPID